MNWSPPEARKRNPWNVLSKLKDTIARTPLQKEYYKSLRIILSNNLTRLVFLALDFILILLLLYLLSLSLTQPSLIGQLVYSLFSLLLLCLPLIYLYRSFNQLNFEMSLNSSIFDARYYIGELTKPKTVKNYRSLQGRINRVRQNLKNFVEYSEILSPPIFNYELDRLQKRIDIFFNCTSEVLIPIKKLFSRAEEYEEEMAQAEYESRGIPPDEELFEIEEEQMRGMTGEIQIFDLWAMDEFMRYLRIALFEKEPKRYSPLSYRHPVNLIVLSVFFGRWNSVLSSCPNCKAVFGKASKDIENYYAQLGRTESKRRQRIWQLRDEALIVILSVGISTFIQYLRLLYSI